MYEAIMVIQSWTEIVIGSLQNLWLGMVEVMPSILGAIVVFIVGLIVASGLGALTQKFIELLKLDDLLSRIGVDTYFKRAGLRLNVGRFLGQIVHWFLIIAFILASSDILGFTSLSGFLKDILIYIPNIVIAVLIMLAAVVLGNFLRGLVRASVMSARLHAAKFLGALTWWSVVVFGFLAALTQLGIAVNIINTLVTGVIAMLALAGGLAFGMGGREYASHLIEKFRDHTENDR